MATVTSLGNTFNTTNGTKTVTATPAVGDLIVIITGHTGNTATTTPTDNNSSGVYVLITSALKNSSADILCAFVRTTTITSATSTIFTHAPGTTSGGGLQVYSLGGMSLTGSGSVRSSGTQANQASGTPAPVLSLTPLTANPVLSAVLNGTNPGGITAPTSFTRDTDAGYNTPTTGGDWASRASGQTNATITWGSSSASAFSSLAVEFDTTVVAPLAPSKLEARAWPYSGWAGQNTLIGSPGQEKVTDYPWAGTNAIWNYERWWARRGPIGAKEDTLATERAVGTVTTHWPFPYRLQSAASNVEQEKPVQDQAASSVPASWKYPQWQPLRVEQKELTAAQDNAQASVSAWWTYGQWWRPPIVFQPASPVAAVVTDDPKRFVPDHWRYGLWTPMVVQQKEETTAKDQALGTTPPSWKYPQWWNQLLASLPNDQVTVVAATGTPSIELPRHWLYPQYWGYATLVGKGEHEPAQDIPWAGTNPIWLYDKWWGKAKVLGGLPSDPVSAPATGTAPMVLPAHWLYSQWFAPSVVGTTEHESFPDFPSAGTNDLWLYQQSFTQRGPIGALPNDQPTFPSATAQPPMVIPAHWPYLQNFSLLGPIGRGEPALAKEVAINASVTGHWMYAQNFAGNPVLLMGFPGTGNPPVVVVVTNHLLYIMGLGT